MPYLLKLESTDGRTTGVGLREDVATYLMTTERPSAGDWRVHDVILAVWAMFQEIKRHG